jgi:hypothetical protein
LLAPTQRLQPGLRQPHDGQDLSRAQLHRQVQDHNPIVASLHRLLEHVKADPKQPGAHAADRRRPPPFLHSALLAEHPAGAA